MHGKSVEWINDKVGAERLHVFLDFGGICATDHSALRIEQLACYRDLEIGLVTARQGDDTFTVGTLESCKPEHLGIGRITRIRRNRLAQVKQ